MRAAGICVEACSLRCIEQLPVLERRPLLFGRRPNRVALKERAQGNGRTLIEQNEHQRRVAGGSRLRTAKSITALA